VVIAPVRKRGPVGEQSAVVCHCEYMSPVSELLERRHVIPPPNGDQAARPVSGVQNASGGPLAARALQETVLRPRR
jgi:hypothetical protein